MTFSPECRKRNSLLDSFFLGKKVRFSFWSQIKAAIKKFSLHSKLKRRARFQFICKTYSWTKAVLDQLRMNSLKFSLHPNVLVSLTKLLRWIWIKSVVCRLSTRKHIIKCVSGVYKHTNYFNQNPVEFHNFVLLRKLIKDCIHWYQI